MLSIFKYKCYSHKINEGEEYKYIKYQQKAMNSNWRRELIKLKRRDSKYGRWKIMPVINNLFMKIHLCIYKTRPHKWIKI